MGSVLKKELVALILLFIISTSGFGIDWREELQANFVTESSIWVGHTEGHMYQREGNVLIRRYYDGANYRFVPLQFSEIVLNESSGFLEGFIEGNPMHIVLGDAYLFVTNKNLVQWRLSDVNGMRLGMAHPLVFYQRENPEDSIQYFTPPYIDMLPFSKIQKEIHSSSYLSEVVRGIQVQYDGTFFHDYLIWAGTVPPHSSFNPFAYPWVENVEGPGIGEWIQVDIDEPRDRFYVLNGFVDVSRPHLYKMNSRVKDALVIGTTTDGRRIEQTVRFEDFVYFRTISFPEPVISMRLVIQSAYPGSRWQDTSISAIMLPPDWPRPR